MLIDQSKAARIAQYLDASTQVPDRAELAFVFGTRYREPAYIAADLARRDIVKYVVLTGGDNPYTGKKEADTHLEVLRREEIPSNRIILENESRNTLENVLCALPKIQDRVSLEHIQAVVVVTKWYHSRRAIMTLKRHLTEGIRYYAVVYEPDGVWRSSWWKEEGSYGRVMKEWQNIPRYLVQGDIVEIQELGHAFV